MGPKNLQRRLRYRRRKLITKTNKTTNEALAEDIRRVQGIGDDNGGGIVLMTGPIDWQQQQSVDFPCYRVANSNTVSSLSRLP